LAIILLALFTALIAPAIDAHELQPGFPLPGVEMGIALSALVLGALVLAEVRPPLWLAVVVVALFAIFHAHVALTPADLRLVIAVALLAGQRGARAARWTLVTPPVAWPVGGVIGAQIPIEGTLPLVTTLSFAVAGGLVALSARLPAAAIAGCAPAGPLRARGPEWMCRAARITRAGIE
jgi:hydrogenase/urease accessory protein HupE